MYFAKRISPLAAALSAAVAVAAPGQAHGRTYDGSVELDHADGFYKSGETVHCKVLLTKDGQPLKGARARLVLKWELEVIGTEEFETTGDPVEFTYSSDKPGWVYFGFEVLGKDGKPLSGPGVCKLSRKPTIVTEIGALFDADKIATVVRDPPDFDEFWAKRIAEVHAAPLMPELTELDSKAEGVKLFAVRIPVVRGIMASGYLAYPAAAMDKDVSLAVVSVPSFCECNAFEAGRSPHGVYRRKVPVEKLKADPGLVEGGFYYDAVNFGRRLTCETYVCTGFTDESCCPSNVFAFFNAIPATTKKTMTTNPRTGHFGTTKAIKGDSRIAEIFHGTMIGEQPKP